MTNQTRATERPEAVKISRITINIGGKTINITTNEAKELKEALDEVFPAQVDPVQIHWHHEPYWVPDVPYSPHWRFGAETTPGGTGVSTCAATLNVDVGGNIII